MVFTRRHSVKYRYLFSYLGIALLCCVVLGLILYVFSVNEFRKTKEAATMEQLRLLARDMDAQYDSMRVIIGKVAGNPSYKANFIRLNNYNESVMLQDFSKYRDFSPIVENYYLFYHGNSWVYQDNGMKSSFEVWHRAVISQEAPDALRERLFSGRWFQIIPQETRNGEALLFCWTFDIVGGVEPTAATMLFIVPKAELGKRIHMLGGGLQGALHIYYQEQPIAGFGGEGLPDVPEEWRDGLERRGGSTRFIAQGDAGRFRILLDLPNQAFLSNLVFVSRVNIAYTVLAVLLMLSIAGFAAYRNYRPIQRVYEKLKGPSGPEAAGDELEKIEQAVLSLLRDKDDAILSQQASYKLIRRQILQLLLKGDNRYSGLVADSFMDISMPGPYYSVLAVAIPEDGPESEQEWDALYAQVEKLSEEERRLYCADTGRAGCFAVLCSLTERNMRYDAQEMVGTLLRESYAAAIGASPVVNGISFLQEALLHALSDLDSSGAGAIPPESFAYNASQEKRFMAAIRMRNIADAEHHLQLLLQEIHGREGGFASERYLYYRLLGNLCGDLEEKGIYYDMKAVSVVINAMDFTETLAGFRALVRSVCARPSDDALQARGPQAGKKHSGDEIISYLEVNYGNPDITLDFLSTHFNLNSRYISILIKEKSGMSYTDYLTLLRITKAQELLLVTDMTVTQVCARVGYSHLPHFIKTFKRITGETPSRYTAP